MSEPIVQPSAGKSLTPSMPQEPPKEVKEMQFTAPDNLSNLLGDTDSTITIDKKEVKTETAEIKKEEQQIAAPKVEEKVVTQKEEKPKVEEKKSVLKAPVDEKKSTDTKVTDATQAQKPGIKAITPVKEVKSGQDTFDYSKYTNEQQHILKQMSNVAKTEYAKVLDENKQLSSLKDSNYLQHENGYTLSPDFQKLQQDNYRAQIEGQCWEKTLLDIKAGKDYQEIVGFDKNGNPIMSEAKKATDRDEIRVANNLSMCIGASIKYQGEMQQFPNQFKQRINQDLQSIKEVQKERFAWHQDPKLLDYSISIEGKGDVKLKDIKSDFKSMWPQYLQNSPAVDVAADMFVAMQIQGAELAEARNGQQVAQIKQEEVARGEPSSDNREVATKTNGVLPNGVPKEFSLNGIGETIRF